MCSKVVQNTQSLLDIFLFGTNKYEVEAQQFEKESYWHALIHKQKNMQYTDRHVYANKAAWKASGGRARYLDTTEAGLARGLQCGSRTTLCLRAPFL